MIAALLAIAVTFGISTYAATSTIEPARGDFEAEAMQLPGQGGDGTGGGTCNSTRSPSNFASAGPGADWHEQENISVSDNNRAESDILDAPPAQNFTEALLASNFGFQIPTNAIITGFTVRIEKLAGPTGVMYDRVLRLAQGSNALGDNRAGQGTPAVPDSTRPAGQWPRGDQANETYYTYGGSTDRWGTALTPAYVNASNFGVWFEVINGGGFAADGGGARALIDHMQVTVHCQVS